MDNLLTAAILYVIYTIISFWLFNGNLLSPSVVFSSSFAVMLCLAYYTTVNMGMLFAIGLKTFYIFAIAGFIFVLTEFFVYLSRASSSPLDQVEIEPKREPLIVDVQIQIAVMIILAFSFVLMVYVVRASTPGGTWGARMRAYKTLVYANPGAIKFRFITSQLYKINLCITDLFNYIMFYNITVCHVPIRKMLLYMASSAIFIVYSAVYNGGRQGSVEVVIFMTMIYIALNMKPNGKKKIYKFLLGILPVFALIGAFFSVAGNLVGRGETTKSPFVYVAEYLCGGVYHFNLHVNDHPNKIFGPATFQYIYMILANLGIDFHNIESEINSGFELYGNTVTTYGRWRKDFGPIGVFVMTSIVSYIYSRVFYHKLLYTSNLKKENHCSRICYCQFMTGLFWACYDDRIASLISVQTVVTIVTIRIFYWLLIDKKFKFI